MATRTSEAKLQKLAAEQIARIARDASRRMTEILSPEQGRILAIYFHALATQARYGATDEERAVVRLVNSDPQLSVTLGLAREIIARFEGDPGKLLPE